MLSPAFSEVLEAEVDPLAVLEVRVPVDGVDEHKGEGEDDPGDAVDLGDGVERLLRVLHGAGDAALAAALVQLAAPRGDAVRGVGAVCRRLEKRLQKCVQTSYTR